MFCNMLINSKQENVLYVIFLPHTVLRIRVPNQLPCESTKSIVLRGCRRAQPSLPRLRSTCLPENWGHSSSHHSINNTFTSVHPHPFGFFFFHFVPLLVPDTLTPRAVAGSPTALVLPGYSCHLRLFFTLDVYRNVHERFSFG